MVKVRCSKWQSWELNPGWFAPRTDIFGRADTKTLGSNKLKGHKGCLCGWRYQRRSESVAKVKAWSLFQPRQQHQAMQRLSVIIRVRVFFHLHWWKMQGPPPLQRHLCPNPQNLWLLIYMIKIALKMWLSEGSSGGEASLHYPAGPNAITSIPIRRKQRVKSGRVSDVQKKAERDGKVLQNWLWGVGRGREPRQAGKGKVSVFSPRAPGGWQGGPAHILVLFQWNPFQASDLQNHKIMTLCCFKHWVCRHMFQKQQETTTGSYLRV